MPSRFSSIRNYLACSTTTTSTKSGVFSPGDTEPNPSLTAQDIDLWEHAALLHHGYEWQASIDAFKNLAGRLNGEYRTLCALNVSIIQSRLGDNLEARQTLEAAATYDPNHIMIPFILALVEWDLGNLAKTQACLNQCWESLSKTERVDFRAQGLEFVLTADYVHKLLRYLRETGFDRYGTARRGIVHVVPSVLPAEYIFEAPLRPGADPRASVGDGYGFVDAGSVRGSAVSRGGSIVDPRRGESQFLAETLRGGPAIPLLPLSSPRPNPETFPARVSSLRRPLRTDSPAQLEVLQPVQYVRPTNKKNQAKVLPLNNAVRTNSPAQPEILRPVKHDSPAKETFPASVPLLSNVVHTDSSTQPEVLEPVKYNSPAKTALLARISSRDNTVRSDPDPQPEVSPPIKYVWPIPEIPDAGGTPVAVVQTSLGRWIPVAGARRSTPSKETGIQTKKTNFETTQDVRPLLHSQKSSVSFRSGPKSPMSTRRVSAISKQTTGPKFDKIPTETWIDRAARRLAEGKSKKPACSSRDGSTPGDRSLRFKASGNLFSRLRRPMTSFPAAPNAITSQVSLPPPQPKRIPRDPRGEYGDIMSIVAFLREHDHQAPLDLFLQSPRGGPRKVPPSKELAAFLQSAARDRLCVDNSGAFSYNLAREDLLIGAPMPWANQATREILEAGKRHSAPGLHDPSSSPSRRMRSSRYPYAEPKNVSDNDDDEEAADNTIEQILELYTPQPKHRHLPPRPSTPPARHSIQLMEGELTPTFHNPFRHIHTAASSSSSLFADSLVSVERTERARDAAMRMLEGRRRATLLPCARKGVKEEESGDGGGGKERLEALLEEVGQAPLRMASGEIFAFMRRHG
ncbi:hypothetical protein LTR91_001319 [Friedmanniomyces endolithicus]|uniref:Uncharacterized protein n=1 Tax=Friedmanniomyces endolithicus TaxID=329885 RepID=A0AAN6L2C0_9PEZI|nr:hypothetical protein LTR35_012617 [Friedmanniomyces endolithicus]KAK0283859.1 hypothetical protein LTS00_011522 [Friedmanniomyces endolithicus]KAK0320429.1 hypothetical protein LTR82_008544 [Friedmanniomyces endolithicus]KAK0929804.1 hypothetical protein LTR57_001661 [Friedmanniomyces endolithicus]KAK0990413.1 hypothetical protein LTR54_012166 [Friedmanniomyces endolithicus]